jgi:hypothetical protein
VIRQRQYATNWISATRLPTGSAQPAHTDRRCPRRAGGWPRARTPVASGARAPGRAALDRSSPRFAPTKHDRARRTDASWSCCAKSVKPSSPLDISRAGSNTFLPQGLSLAESPWSFLAILLVSLLWPVPLSLSSPSIRRRTREAQVSQRMRPTPLTNHGDRAALHGSGPRASPTPRSPPPFRPSAGSKQEPVYGLDRLLTRLRSGGCISG